MLELAIAAVAFPLVHLVVAGTRLRDALVKRIGAGGYLAAYSVASLALLIWLVRAFGAARGSGANVIWWAAPDALKILQLGLQLLALLLVVPGLTTPNPTSAGQEAVVDRPEPARGMVRITRHPFLWGVAIWAIGHLIVNGSLAAYLFFGAFLVLSLVGVGSIDAKRRRALGDRWAAFAAITSALPFAAIATGRQTLRLGEIGLWRIALAVALWAGLIALHPVAFGVSALPTHA